jgi:GNAT superfamily N-acetyltransferase
MIRPATVTDAAAMASLSDQLGYPAEPAEIRERLSDILSRDGHAVFVAEEGGAVTGWIHVAGRRLVEIEAFAEIGGLVVDAARRGRGIGTQLLKAAEAWSSRMGYATLRVRSNMFREDAHRFYEQRGFQGAKRQAVFVKNLR